MCICVGKGGKAPILPTPLSDLKLQVLRYKRILFSMVENILDFFMFKI